MMAYENDNLVIPESYKKMSVSELEREKEKILEEIYTSERPRKVLDENKSDIVFLF